jgi:hypothetical protein
MTKAPPLEKTITNNILKYLNSLERCRARKIPGGMYGGGWPDIICVYRGRTIFFEVKRPKVGVLTALQERELQAWREVGALAFVVTSVDDVRRLVS